jgi:hypothetical protein
VTSFSLPITADHLRGLPGLRRAARDALLAIQPRTVREALRIPDVARKTAYHLVSLGLLVNDDDYVRARLH